jgi:serine/threonine protein kinase
LDIYSTGLILFEMITGVNPFEDARDSKELLVAHLTRSAPRLSALTHGMPAELDAVVEQMLSKDRAERPASALDVSALLTHLRERWHEIAKANERAAVAFLPTLSAAATPDTTRPDGVASRRTTMETSSAGPIAWTRDSDAHTAAVAPTEAGQGVAFEPTAATVRALSGAPGNLVPEGSAVPAGTSPPATERLTSTPVPPTRTKHPHTPSETPSSRKRSGEFRPDLTPIPDFRAGNHWLPWAGLSLLGLALGLGALLLRGGDELAVPPAPVTTPATKTLTADRSALRPEAPPAAPAPPATPLAPLGSAPAPLASTPSNPRPARADGADRARRARVSHAERPASSGPAPEPAPAAPKRPAPAEQALPASGL